MAPTYLTEMCTFTCPLLYVEVMSDLQCMAALQYLVPRGDTDKEALLFLVQPYGTRCH